MNPGRSKDSKDNPTERPPLSIAAQRNIAVVDHRIDSRDIFIATREITISHAGEIYRLRLTAQNKLILTK